MTLTRKNGSAKAGQPINTGMSQAVPHKAVDNVFDGVFVVEPSAAGFIVRRRCAHNWKYYATLDDLMTFLADQAIEKIGRVSL